MGYLTQLLRHSQNPFIEATANGDAYGAHFGTVTTPIASPATTAITARRPQAWLRVLDGRVVIPMALRITVESAGVTTQGEIAVAITTNDVGNSASSAAASVGPLNLRTDSSKTSSCIPRQLAAADVIAETGYLELERFSFAASAVNQKFIVDPTLFPVLVGGSTLAVYFGGNAVNFYAQLQWMELPEELAN